MDKWKSKVPSLYCVKVFSNEVLKDGTGLFFSDTIKGTLFFKVVSGTMRSVQKRTKVASGANFTHFDLLKFVFKDRNSNAFRVIYYLFDMFPVPGK